MPYTLLAMLLAHPLYSVHKAAGAVVARHKDEPTFLDVTIKELHQYLLKESASADAAAPKSDAAVQVFLGFLALLVQKLQILTLRTHV